LDGRGAPGSDGFTTAIEALYGMAYTIKMRRKVAGGPDYVVGKLGARYWVEEDRDMDAVSKEDWLWTLQIRTPDFIRQTAREEAVTALLGKGKGERVRAVALIGLEEGRCVQVLHVDTYERERDNRAHEGPGGAPWPRIPRATPRALSRRPPAYPARAVANPAPTPCSSPLTERPAPPSRSGLFSRG